MLIIGLHMSVAYECSLAYACTKVYTKYMSLGSRYLSIFVRVCVCARVCV